MLTATIAAGLFVRLLVTHFAHTITGSTFFLDNKIINFLGAAAFVAVLLGAQNQSVDIGIYIGFFFFDILSTFVSIIKTIRLAEKDPKYKNKKKESA